MIKFFNQNNSIYFIFFFNQICSIRFFLNSSFFNKDIIYFYIYVLFTTFIFYFFYSRKILNFFLSNKVFYVILSLFLIFMFYNYPIQENLKVNLQGSDQDNCYLDIANNIINSKNFIYSKSYLGNPCSTGLMAFLFYFPVFFFKNYFIFVPIIFLLIFKNCSYLISQSYKLSNLITFILMSNLVFLELSVSGSDFISISISYVIGNIFFIQGIKQNNNLKIFISFIFFLFFFGSRSVLLLSIFPLCFIYYYKFKKIKILIYFFTIFFLATNSFLIPYFLFQPSDFPPFHLVSKAYWYFLNVKYVLLILAIILLYYRKYLIKLVDTNFEILILSIVLLPLLLPAFSGFIYNLEKLSKWEELNYIYLFTPSLFIYLISKYKIK
jgi:hypothetical protein